MAPLQSTAITTEIAAKRLAKIKEEMKAIADFESSYEYVLQTISMLSNDSFKAVNVKSKKLIWNTKTLKSNDQTWTYYVSYTSDTITIKLSLLEQHCLRTGVLAYKILFSKKDPEFVEVKAINRIKKTYICHMDEEVKKYGIEDF